MNKFPKVKAHEGLVIFEGNYADVAICQYLGEGAHRMHFHETARRIAAALNATRHLTTEQLESSDPLGYETVCREQRERARKRLQMTLAIPTQTRLKL